MTKFLPFPPALVETSAKNAMASRNARSSKGDHDIANVAAYRLPDGALRAAHDLYVPQYPEGAEPGIATLHCKLRHYPNDSSGYHITASGFVPAAEFLRDHPLHDPARREDPMDRLAIAHARIGEESGFIWAFDETQMKSWIDGLPKGARITRACLTRHGMGQGEVATAAFLVKSMSKAEIHVGSSVEALAEGLKNRFAFVETAGLDAEAVIGRISEHGQARGWIVDSDVINLQDVKSHGPGCGCASCVLRTGNDWVRELIGFTPDGAMIRPRQEIANGMIVHERGTLLVHAADKSFAKGYCEAVIEKLPGENAGPFLDVDGDNHFRMEGRQYPSFYLLNASASLAYGYEPRHLAVLMDGAASTPGMVLTDRMLGFAAGNERNLAGLIREHLEQQLPELDFTGVRDIGDIRDVIAISDRYRITHMEVDELDERIEQARLAVSEETVEP